MTQLEYAIMEIREVRELREKEAAMQVKGRLVCTKCGNVYAEDCDIHTKASQKELRTALYAVLQGATSGGLWRGNPYRFDVIRDAIKTLNQGTVFHGNSMDLPKEYEIDLEGD